MDKQADPKALKVCIMTADFWGLKSAGGTATAYHLLAAVLAKSKALHVSVPSTLPGNQLLTVQTAHDFQRQAGSNPHDCSQVWS